MTSYPRLRGAAGGYLARQTDPDFVPPGIARMPRGGTGTGGDEGVRLEDFYAYMEQHKYIYAPTRARWPGASPRGSTGTGPSSR
jgi:hypothetical protein